MHPLRLFVFGSSIVAAAALHGQGALTPPGPPAPTMKSLDQIEARTIVNATNTPGDATNMFIISAPGSYYLTGNITGAPGKHGISILANNVTLDLNGFALIGGVGAAVRGVDTTTPITNFCIRNGSVSGWTDGGVRADFAVTLAENLRLSDNVGALGLAVGNGSMVKDCVASGNGTGFNLFDRTQINNCISTVNTGNGFSGTSYVNLIDCTASRNGANGFDVQGSCAILRCSATRNIPSGKGINTRGGCTVTDCTAGGNGTDGIVVDSGSAVRNCTASTNAERGIVASASCQLTGNTCDSNKIGIEVTGNDNRVDGNICAVNPAQNAVSGYLGFYIHGQNNWIVRNVARGSFAGTQNDLGFVFDAYGLNAVGPWESTSTSPINSISPWANFRQ